MAVSLSLCSQSIKVIECLQSVTTFCPLWRLYDVKKAPNLAARCPPIQSANFRGHWQNLRQKKRKCFLALRHPGPLIIILVAADLEEKKEEIRINAYENGSADREYNQECCSIVMRRQLFRALLALSKESSSSPCTRLGIEMAGLPTWHFQWQISIILNLIPRGRWHYNWGV